MKHFDIRIMNDDELHILLKAIEQNTDLRWISGNKPTAFIPDAEYPIAICTVGGCIGFTAHIKDMDDSFLSFAEGMALITGADEDDEKRGKDNAAENDPDEMPFDHDKYTVADIRDALTKAIVSANVDPKTAIKLIACFVAELAV